MSGVKTAPVAPGVYDTELICSSNAAENPPATVKRLATDSAVGSNDVFYLTGTWFYDKPLDVQGIKKSMTALVTKLPVLAARRRDEHTVILSNAGARFSACAAHPGSAHDFTGADRHVEPKRGTLADNPLGYISDPLFTVRVTNFVDGTSAIGIASPHSITDGKAYFMVVSAFATFHDTGSFELATLPNFDSARVWEEAMPTIDPEDRASFCCGPSICCGVPCITKLARPFARSMVKNLDQSLPRAKVHLSQAELAELKAAIGDTAGAGVTANEAISSALLVALAPHWPKFPTNMKKPGTVSMVVNAQGKGVFKGVKNMAGNFSLYAIKETPKPAREMSMAEAAALFKAIGNEWRDESHSAETIKKFVGFFRYMDIFGRFPKPGHKYDWSDADNASFHVNNQTTYPVAQIRFGPGSLIGFCPWHSLQQVHILPSVEHASGHAKPQLMRQASFMKRLVGSLDTATAFQRHNVSGSGKISRSELRDALRTAGVELNEEEVDGMFELLDKDTSGSIDLKKFDAAFYAARLAGGVDVYIPVLPKMGGRPQREMVAHLESDAFKHTLLHGWR